MTLRRPLRIALVAIAALVVIVVAAGAIFISRFDPNSLKPRIAEAVKRATGRDLALNGKISIGLSLTPTIRAADVAFSNPPGFSRPNMATLQSMELELGLLPLLSSRIEIDHLVLNHPDILLETAKTGQTNWQMTPEGSSAGSGQARSPAPKTAIDQTPMAVSVDTIRIQDGVLAYRNDATGKVTTLGLTDLQAQAASPDAPLHLVADATFQKTPLHLTADTGSLVRLQQPDAASPWPVKLTLSAAGSTLAADGSITRPLLGKGYSLAITGAVSNAATLAPLIQGIALPALHDVSFAAKIADAGSSLPQVSTLTLHVGSSDLGGQVRGLTLDKLDVAAPGMGQPTRLNAAAALNGAPVTAVGTFGPLAQLMPGAKAAPFPVDMTVQSAGATATAKGAVANPQALSGVALALSASIPDLSGLSALAGRPLPAIKAVGFQGSLSDAGGLRRGAALRSISLSSADGDLSGDLGIGLQPRISLTANLKSNRIDADAIQAAIANMPPAKPAPPQPASPSGGSQPTRTTQPAPPGQRGNFLFSDKPIPLNLLRTADADMTLAVAQLHSGGEDYKAITTHAGLTNGKLAVDPFSAELPGGHLSGKLSVDATPPAPPVHLVLHAPGLALKTILAAVHQPSYASGNLEIYADLGGSGDSLHAIAASLDGSLGVAIAGGTIDNRLLGSLLGKVMDSLNALNLVGKGGTSELKCFGLRMVARHGTAAIDPLVLSSSLLTLTGQGTINLSTETQAIALRPQGRVGGTNLVIPIAVSGPLRNPSVKVNDLGAAQANAGTVAEALVGNATPLGIVGGLLGGDKLFNRGSSDICPAALAAARGQAVAAAAPRKAGTQGSPNPAALLKNLFR